MVTIQKYQKAINELSERQKEILITLYLKAPFKDANDIAINLKYKNFGAANLQIGTIGKKIAKVLGIEKIKAYSHSMRDRPAFFTLVHDHFNQGWDLQRNLRKAIKIALLTKPEEKTTVLSTEIEEGDNYFFLEGKAGYVLVNKYERDDKAREECLRLNALFA